MLADRLKMPVGMLMASISHEEYLEWRALFTVEQNEEKHRSKVRRAQRSGRR